MTKIKVVRQILEWNEDKSSDIKRLLSDKKVLMINVMGSPGAGKTTLLTAIAEGLRDEFSIAVIEGDVAGKLDAEKMAEIGIPVVQLNTDGACHIEAMSIEAILPEFDLDATDIIFVENIGNLVCPAEFDIGEDARIAVLSVPEGDDKIEKYPLLFSRADIICVNKSDMLPYFDFDVKRIEGQTRTINPSAGVICVSARTGDGIGAVTERIREMARKKLK